MKRINLLFMLLGLTVIGFMSSCDSTENEDETPLLTLTTNGLDSNNEIVENTTYTISVTAAQNPTTTKKLKTLEIQTPGADTTITINAASYQETFTLDAPDAGETEDYTFVLTDNAGVNATETISVTGVSAVTTTDLSAPTAFEWKRVGSNDGIGLDQFGLKWESNTSTSAIITEDADKLVILNSSEWTSITTVEDLIDAVDNGTAATQYDNVSATANGAYDDVLATKNGNDYYLLHVTSSTVSSTTAGTTITIIGDYKN